MNLFGVITEEMKLVSEIHAKVGANIKKERKKKKITITELARGVGVTHSVISRMENGKVKINLDLLFQIANFLDVPIFKLTGDTKEDYDEFLSKDSKNKLEQLQAVLSDKKDEVWTYKDEVIPKETLEKLIQDIDTILAIRQNEIKKSRSH